MIPWRPHDVLVAVVLSKQNYIKETVYILSKYGPRGINIYKGFGKNWFHINADYLNEKLGITVKDKGPQKKVRPVALFARTEKCRCWESAWKPDSQGLGFNQCWPLWGCRCGISKGGQTPGRWGAMAALFEGGQRWGFCSCLLVWWSCIISLFERHEDILNVYTWKSRCSELLAWLARSCSSPQRWAFVLSQAALVTHKADFHKKEKKKMIGVIFYVPY